MTLPLSMALIFGVLTVSPAVLAGPTPVGARVEVYWGDAARPLGTDALREQFGPAVADAAEHWSGLKGYRLELSADGRLLSLHARRTSRKSKTFRERKEIIEGACALVPPREIIGAGDGSAVRPASGVASPAVLIVLHDDGDRYAAIEHVNAWLEQLESTTPNLRLDRLGSAARNSPGFFQTAAAVAALTEHAGLEDDTYKPLHELASRATRLLVLSTYGEQPFWLEMGLSLASESALLGDAGLYAFAYRDEFVPIEDHFGWSGWLGRQYAAAADEIERAREAGEVAPPGFRLDELTVWESRTFHPSRSRKAWGLGRALLELPAATRAALFAELGDITRRAHRIDLGGGHWRTESGRQPDVADQREVLARHLGPDFERDLTLAFADHRDEPTAEEILGRDGESDHDADSDEDPPEKRKGGGGKR